MGQRATRWPGNPLGARALYLYSGGKDTLYRIHGTTEPESIGKSVSSGCVRMLNEDVAELFDQVEIGTPGHRARGVSSAGSGGLAVAPDPEGEGDEEHAKDNGVAADDPDDGKSAVAGAGDDEHAKQDRRQP